MRKNFQILGFRVATFFIVFPTLHFDFNEFIINGVNLIISLFDNLGALHNQVIGETSLNKLLLFYKIGLWSTKQKTWHTP